MPDGITVTRLASDEPRLSRRTKMQVVQIIPGTENACAAHVDVDAAGQ